MCSVVGCESWRRSAQRFKLPEDPERRLEWVQFLFEINGQRLKESCCTDITICSEHFSDVYLLHTFPSGSIKLRSGAVPSMCVKTKVEELEVIYLSFLAFGMTLSIVCRVSYFGVCVGACGDCRNNLSI